MFLGSGVKEDNSVLNLCTDVITLGSDPERQNIAGT